MRAYAYRLAILSLKHGGNATVPKAEFHDDKHNSDTRQTQSALDEALEIRAQIRRGPQCPSRRGQHKLQRSTKGNHSFVTWIIGGYARKVADRNGHHRVATTTLYPLASTLLACYVSKIVQDGLREQMIWGRTSFPVTDAYAVQCAYCNCKRSRCQHRHLLRHQDMLHMQHDCLPQKLLIMS